jgi:uncharacterized membrane protein affecting hemolysin expression
MMIEYPMLLINQLIPIELTSDLFNGRKNNWNVHKIINPK